MVGRVRLGLVGLVAILTAVVVPTGVGAVPLTASPPVEASTPNPLADCPPDGSGVNFLNSEVEPWLEVNPKNADNVVAYYQQDRYSNGGAKGNVAAVSFNGGESFVQVVPPQDTRCTDGGQFDRASDPWISFGPATMEWSTTARPMAA
jgi:hypothetical protein